MRRIGIIVVAVMFACKVDHRNEDRFRALDVDFAARNDPLLKIWAATEDECGKHAAQALGMKFGAAGQWNFTNVTFGQCAGVLGAYKPMCPSGLSGPVGSGQERSWLSWPPNDLLDESKGRNEPRYGWLGAESLETWVLASVPKCKERLSGTELSAALSRIAPSAEIRWDELLLNDEQRRVLTALNGIKRWRWCNEVPITKYGAKYLGLFEEGNVYVYSVSCTTSRIYGFDVSGMDLVTRQVFVMLHEMGHAIDKATGDLSREPAGKELRATRYAVPMLACWLDERAEMFDGARKELDASDKSLSTREHAAVAEMYRCYAEKAKTQAQLLAEGPGRSGFAKVLEQMKNRTACLEW